jgi:hypothetical protein
MTPTSRPDPMRASIAYLTSTAATVVDLLPEQGAHRLDVLGYHRGDRAIYLREDVGGTQPIIHVVRTRGEHAGRMVPMRSWYEGARTIGERLDALAAEVSPLDELDADAWSLTTRVVQRRALRLPNGGAPIRKFAVQLTVEPVIAREDAVIGRTVVTSYLRPRARLDRAWAIPGEPLAVVRVAYVGVPEGVGLDKHVALLVGRDLH